MTSLLNHLAATDTEQADILDLLATVRVFAFALRDRTADRRKNLADRIQGKEEEELVGMVTRLVAGWEETRRAEEALLRQELEAGEEEGPGDESADKQVGKLEAGEQGGARR
jgi:hypothetical protein